MARVTISESEPGERIATSALRADAVATGALVGHEAVATTRNLRARAIKELVGRLGISVDDDDKERWETKIAERFKEVTTYDGLSEDAVRDNWAAQVEAFMELSNRFGMHEVSSTMNADDLSQSLVVALTASGTYFMVAPGVKWNISSKDQQGDGKFAMTYIEGRKGGVKLRRGNRLDAIRATDPANATRALVYSYLTEIDGASGEYVEDWERAGRMPAPHDKLLMYHDRMTDPAKPTLTSEILKVMYITNPQDAEAIMLAFDSATTAVNKETIDGEDGGVAAGQKLPAELETNAPDETEESVEDASADATSSVTGGN